MLLLETEQEEDGRWIAEVRDLPGVLAYGATRSEAVVKAEALALRVLADRLDQGAPVPNLEGLFAALAAGQRRERPCVLAALLRIGWQVARQTGSHRVLHRDGYSDVVFAFHDGEEIGPRMLACIARQMDLRPGDL
jgi:Predicted periplasmic or secreted lipoprotein